MQCKRCKTSFDYESHYGICPKCVYFNRPPGMEEVDLFEEDDRFAREDYRFPEMEANLESESTADRKKNQSSTVRHKRNHPSSKTKQSKKRSSYNHQVIWKLIFIFIILLLTAGIAAGL